MASFFDNLLGLNDSQAQGDLSQAQQYMRPFYNAGTSTLPAYQKTLASLVSNPTGLENSIMGSYQTSPWAQHQLNTMSTQQNRAAAMDGQMGTPNEQVALAQATQPIVSKDEQMYYQNAMQPFMRGLDGEQGLVRGGMMAGQGMMSQEDMQAKLAEEQEAEKGNLFGSAVGGISDLAGMLL